MAFALRDNDSNRREKASARASAADALSITAERPTARAIPVSQPSGASELSDLADISETEITRVCDPLSVIAASELADKLEADEFSSTRLTAPSPERSPEPSQPPPIAPSVEPWIFAPISTLPVLDLSDVSEASPEAMERTSPRASKPGFFDSRMLVSFAVGLLVAASATSAFFLTR